MSTTPVSAGVYGAAVVAHAEKILTTDCSGKAVAPADVTRVLYHGSSCPDGFAAAFVARLKLGERALYLPQDHPPSGGPPSVAGQPTVVVDYCFPRAATEALLAEAGGRFLVLDHHASAEKELAGVADAHKVFVMGQSGATLAWNFFFPGERVPLWLRYVEDKDIWRWALRDSEAFTAGFATVPQTWDAYAALHAGGDAAVAALIAKGASILEYRNGVVDSHVRRAQPAVLRAAPALRARVVCATTLASEIGNALCKGGAADFAIVWSFDHGKREFFVSLRSLDGDRADVSLIAKQFGGGGHKCAAGFSYKGASIEDLLDLGAAKRARKKSA